MSKIYDCCGGRGKHLPGCESAPTAHPSKDDKKHAHDYKVVRTATRRVGREVVMYEFLHCYKNGCPQPDNIRISRSK